MPVESLSLSGGGVELEFRRLIFTKIATILSDKISKLPLFPDKKINNMLQESNAIEIIRRASWVALTSDIGTSALTIEKNHRGHFVIRAHEVMMYERDSYQLLSNVKLLIHKKQVNNHVLKLYREYWLDFKANGTINKVMTKFSSDKDGKTLENNEQVQNFKVELKEEGLDTKIIPVILWKGHLGDDIKISDRINDLLYHAKNLFDIFFKQANLQGVKFLVNGSLVETENRTGQNGAYQIVKALTSGENVVTYHARNNTDQPTVEALSNTTQLQEFRANLDWLLTACVEYSLVPDFNGADKGTAQVGSEEVEATQATKESHLKFWEDVKKEEWRQLIFLYGLLTKYTPAKELDEVPLEFLDKPKVDAENATNDKKSFGEKSSTKLKAGKNE